MTVVGSIFKRDLGEATGTSWEEWVVKLQRTVNPLWSHEQIKAQISEEYGVGEEWAEWLAVMYGQLMGRVPTGVTKDAGVQIGIRKTVDGEPERIWSFLVSPQGLPLWIGHVDDFWWKKGFEFVSKEGVSGKLTVVNPPLKLRLTWQRPDWDTPSRLQIYLLPAKSGKTTIAFHQEMLEDVYMRETMRRHWENVLQRVVEQLELETSR